MRFELDAAGCPLACTVHRMGDDLVVILGGGDRPHIGSTAFAMPRPSLTGAGTSATVSTLNRTGHKDDFLANPIAQGVAARMGCAVTCIAGVHVEDAAPAQITAIRQAVPSVVDRACQIAEGARDA